MIELPLFSFNDRMLKTGDEIGNEMLLIWRKGADQFLSENILLIWGK